MQFLEILTSCTWQRTELPCTSGVPGRKEFKIEEILYRFGDIYYDEYSGVWECSGGASCREFPGGGADRQHQGRESSNG